MKNLSNKIKKKNSSLKKNKKTKKAYIPFRLNILFFVIFSLFVILVVRVGYLQIIKGEHFVKQVNENSSLAVTTSTPRGQIYDVNGNLLVGNKATPSITYTRGKKIEGKDILPIANRVNELIDVPVDDNLTERDKKDYWLANPKHLEMAQKRLSKAETTNKDDGKKIDDEGKLYKLTVDKVKTEEIAFDEHTLKAATIFKRMNATPELNTAFIKNKDVTEKEIAVIGEHSAEIAGVSTGMDWDREYTKNNMLRSIFGTVSSEKAGLPEKDINKYLAKGYVRNDRVGTSYLEEEYEPILQGKKAKSEIVLDKDGKIVSQSPTSKGERGENLKLTIDSKFQEKVDQIVQKNFNQIITSGLGAYSPGAYAVVTNPKTGAVLAMSAVKRDLKTNKIESNPLGTIVDLNIPGSVVKGATLTAGYQTGVISGNDVQVDEPIVLAGSPIKRSYFNKTGGPIPITAKESLEYSSNVYMMKLVFKMMHLKYTPGMAFPYQLGDDTVFNKLRKAYSEYGLGVKTGIDIPMESPGYVPSDFKNKEYQPTGGSLLDLSFGQYDTYTALQLAQYVSTIANNGRRMKPYIVDGIYDSNEDSDLGKIKKQTKPKELNKVTIAPEQLKIIQEGFYDVVHGTGPYTTGRGLKDTKIDIAAKTGTAESFIQDANGTPQSTINSNLIAYGPFENPEVAVSVVLPNLSQNATVSPVNQILAKEILNTYYDMYMKK
ncbi:penicillin-binding protein 2 [Melissococcus plutonius]|uniref:Uncharacterized protein YqgF n=1 Tax=Melissococcus plutonius TaxID=33970 RepID=A0A2Z5Y3E1_9ENTE|nr:penicillin-binding protein 2 [Melissococcus plutonius]BAL62535.1 cell division protein FtsI, peptidoglycansynthetase [Melissococcus plutonius DAT561]AIM24640.1 penicillin-binding protein 2B [Melissococcus plutonius S1]KMT24735.1 penicillin-binding protein 2B [Melissococcus plutonius]KMT26372.1 penicillin-binding protein 2B [Melissococcus plutonius]KMT27622.1 penicillin-binding protein 2B [Melissococcus plutonius]